MLSSHASSGSQESQAEYFHIIHFLILLTEDARGWIWEILHAKPMLSHRATPQTEARGTADKEDYYDIQVAIL